MLASCRGQERPRRQASPYIRRTRARRMAHQPTFRPDPLRRSQPPDEHGSVPSSQPRWIEEGDRVHLAELAATLASYGGGDAATQPAAELFLYQNLGKGRPATAGGGGVVAPSPRAGKGLA